MQSYYLSPPTGADVKFSGEELGRYEVSQDDFEQTFVLYQSETGFFVLEDMGGQRTAGMEDNWYKVDVFPDLDELIEYFLDESKILTRKGKALLKVCKLPVPVIHA